MIFTALLYVIAAYLIGSISPGVALGRMLKGIDIRNYGSGNTGATNVLRTLGPVAASLAFVVDTLKGAAAVWLGSRSGNAYLPFACGLAAMLGHIYPFYIKFRGGKGVATAAGILFILFPRVATISIAIFILVLLIFRYVSLATIVTTILTIPLLVIFKGTPREIVFLSILAALIIWRHRTNIIRLWTGKESKIGEKVRIDNGK
jgi:glycerol-3-phosphate acyltransferase PlsY